MREVKERNNNTVYHLYVESKKYNKVENETEKCRLYPRAMSLSKLHEIAKDREAWRATVHEVINSWIRLRN